MRKIFSTAAALLVTAIATPAFAQDNPRGEFNGFYIGGSVGATFNSSNENATILFDRDLNGSFNDTVTTSGGANAFAPNATVTGAGFCGGSVGTNASRPSSGCTADNTAIEYNGRIGFDRQMGNFVIGLVAEGGKSDYRSSTTAFSITPASYTFTREVEFLANLRIRAGIAVAPKTLVYLTGGVAYASLDNSFTTTNTANSFTRDLDDNSTGFVLGAGVEHKLARNISLGVEYLYQQFQDDSTVRAGNNGTTPATNPFLLGNAGGTDFARSDDEFDLQSVRAVLNFRF